MVHQPASPANPPSIVKVPDTSKAGMWTAGVAGPLTLETDRGATERRHHDSDYCRRVQGRHRSVALADFAVALNACPTTAGKALAAVTSAHSLQLSGARARRSARGCA